MGKPKIFDTRYLENGTFECLYGYETDENWAKKEYGGTSWIFYSMGQEQLDNERILINSVRSYSMRPDNIFVLSW